MSYMRDNTTEDDQMEFAISTAIGIGELMVANQPQTVPKRHWWIVGLTIVAIAMQLWLWASFSTDTEQLANTAEQTQQSALGFDESSEIPGSLLAPVAVPVHAGPMEIKLDVDKAPVAVATEVQTPADTKVAAQIIEVSPKVFEPYDVPEVSKPSVTLETRLHQLERVLDAPATEQTMTQPKLEKPTIDLPASPTVAEIAGLIANYGDLTIPVSAIAGYTQPRQWWCGFTPFTDRICDANPLDGPFMWNGQIKVLLGRIMPSDVKYVDGGLAVAVSKPVLSSLGVDVSEGTASLLVPLNQAGQVAQPIVDSTGKLSIDSFVTVNELSIEDAASFAQQTSCRQSSLLASTAQTIKQTIATRLQASVSLPLNIMFTDGEGLTLSTLTDVCS